MPLAAFRLVFLGIVLLSVLGNTTAPYLLTNIHVRGNDWRAETVLVGGLNGLLIGEFVSIAFWILFDSISLTKKLLFGTSLGLFVAASLIVGLQASPGMPVSAGVFILVSGSLFPLLLACLFYCVQRLTSRKLEARLWGESGRNSKQYGIGLLLGVMVAVAFAITIIRSVLPSGGDDWLSSWEFVFLSLWFVWLAIGSTLFIWFPFLSILRPSVAKIATALIFAVFGPSFFQWIASFVLIGRFQFQLPLMFPPLAQSISFGLLFTSLLMGVLIRLLGPAKKEGGR